MTAKTLGTRAWRRPSMQDAKTAATTAATTAAKGAAKGAAALAALALAGCAATTPEVGGLGDPTQGYFIYFADAAVFEPCGGGRLPVAQEGAYLDAERAYLDARPGPAEPVFIRLDATVEERRSIEGPPQPHLVIAALGGVEPGGVCP